jgi:FtsH-binding integral membrane protein
MPKENLSDSEKFTISHLSIIRIFAIWGLLEAIIYFITNGNQKMELIIHLLVFIGINLYISYNKHLIKYM